jgi:hypothetical protein
MELFDIQEMVMPGAPKSDRAQITAHGTKPALKQIDQLQPENRNASKLAIFAAVRY